MPSSRLRSARTPIHACNPSETPDDRPGMRRRCPRRMIDKDGNRTSGKTHLDVARTLRRDGLRRDLTWGHGVWIRAPDERQASRLDGLEELAHERLSARVIEVREHPLDRQRLAEHRSEDALPPVLLVLHGDEADPAHRRPAATWTITAAGAGADVDRAMAASPVVAGVAGVLLRRDLPGRERAVAARLHAVRRLHGAVAPASSRHRRETILDGDAHAATHAGRSCPPSEPWIARGAAGRPATSSVFPRASTGWNMLCTVAGGTSQPHPGDWYAHACTRS